MEISSSGACRVLKRHGPSTRPKPLSLVAGSAAAPEPEPRPRLEGRHLDVDHPGELVQVDRSRIGRIQRTKGVVRQYTAIDVGSAYGWTSLHITVPISAAGHVHDRV